MLKKSVERRTREVLEEATKRTEAEQAQKLQNETVQQSPNTQSERPSAPTTPVVGSKRQNSTENTSTHPPAQTSPYRSPQEASYASLARSIAVAAAAAAMEAAAANGSGCGSPSAGIPMLGYNPFFNSSIMAGSGSMISGSTTVGTALSSSPSSLRGTSFKPSRVAGTSMLSENLSNSRMDPSICPGHPALSRVNSCPPDLVDSVDVVIASRNNERPQLTLVAVAEQQRKRRRPRLSPSGMGMARSKSSMGLCRSSSTDFFPLDVQHLSIPQPSPTGFQGTTSTPSSSMEMPSLTEGLNIKKVSPEKGFVGAHGPLTPISPSAVAAVNNNDAFTESPTITLAHAARFMKPRRPQLAYHIEDIFSHPPAAPADSMGPPNPDFFAGDISDISSQMYDEHISFSPTQMFVAETYSMPEDGHMVGDVLAMSYDPAQDEFDISSYLEI